MPELIRDGARNQAGKGNWHRVADLPHRLGARTLEPVFVRKALDASALPNRHVSVSPIPTDENVLSARHSMHAGLYGLRGPIKVGATVPVVKACAADANMVEEPRGLSPLHRFGEVSESVTDCPPPLNLGLSAAGYRPQPRTPGIRGARGNAMLLPVGASHLRPQQRVSAMARLRETPLDPKVGAKPHDQDPPSLLWNAVIGSIY